MKKIQQIFGKAGMIGMICLLTAALFSSCLKHSDSNDVPTPAGLVTVINTSPDAPAQDFYLNNNKVNLNPIAYGHGLDYSGAYTGKRTVNFYNAGTTTLTKSDTLTVVANRYYSVYLANVLAHPDIVVLRDTISQPAAGKATIRLVNLSPDAGAVDLVVNNTVLAANKAYKDASGFVTIGGIGTYTLEVRQAGTTTVLASIANATIYANSVYTIWLQGLKNATDQTKLAAGLQQNVYYY